MADQSRDQTVKGRAATEPEPALPDAAVPSTEDGARGTCGIFAGGQTRQDGKNLPQKAYVKLNNLDKAAGRLAIRMWREAVDYKNPPWPPVWLIYVGATLLLLTAFKTIVPIVSGVFVAIGFGLGDLVSGSELAQVVTTSVRRYLDDVGPRLGISGQLLWKYWAISGIGLFATACVGLIGGRLGWAIFGLVTGAIVHAEAPESSQLLIVCVVAVWWSLLSVLAFYLPFKWRSQGKHLDRLSNKFQSRTATARQTAENACLALGYADLSEYFDDKGNLALDKVAKELGVKREEAKTLRLECVPKGFKIGGRFSPKQKRAILEECDSGDTPLSDIAKRHDVTVRTLRNWMKAEVRD